MYLSPPLSFEDPVSYRNYSAPEWVRRLDLDRSGLGQRAQRDEGEGGGANQQVFRADVQAFHVLPCATQ
jgi:hypothetical protein